MSAALAFWTPQDTNPRQGSLSGPAQTPPGCSRGEALKGRFQAAPESVDFTHRTSPFQLLSGLGPPNWFLGAAKERQDELTRHPGIKEVVG